MNKFKKITSNLIAYVSRSSYATHTSKDIGPYLRTTANVAAWRNETEPSAVLPSTPNDAIPTKLLEVIPGEQSVAASTSASPPPAERLFLPQTPPYSWLKSSIKWNGFKCLSPKSNNLIRSFNSAQNAVPFLPSKTVQSMIGKQELSSDCGTKKKKGPCCPRRKKGKEVEDADPCNCVKRRPSCGTEEPSVCPPKCPSKEEICQPKCKDPVQFCGTKKCSPDDASKTDVSCKKMDCKKKDPCKKEDSGKKKNDPCKKKDSGKKKKDPCKKKKDSGKKKKDPCKKKKDPCKKKKKDSDKKKKDPCKDPCKKEDSGKKKKDPCKKEDSGKKKKDPCKKEDSGKKKKDPCKKKKDPCKKKDSNKKRDSNKKKKDPCKKKDSGKKKKDPCKSEKDKKPKCPKKCDGAATGSKMLFADASGDNECEHDVKPGHETENDSKLQQGVLAEVDILDMSNKQDIDEYYVENYENKEYMLYNKDAYHNMAVYLGELRNASKASSKETCDEEDVD